MIQLTIPKKMAAKHCWWCHHVLSHFPWELDSNQYCRIRFKQWGSLYLWLHDISTRCTASRLDRCWSPYFVVSLMDSRGNLFFFFCCLFVSTTIYWSFFYLSPIDFKKVHLRKENRGDLIARWVIRDAMIPSFSFIYEGYIGGGVNLGLLWWKGCNWWTSVSSGWQSAWKKCHDLFGFITNKLCYVYRTTKIGEMNREDCNSFFYRRWSTA